MAAMILQKLFLSLSICQNRLSLFFGITGTGTTLVKHVTHNHPRADSKKKKRPKDRTVEYCNDRQRRSEQDWK
jgi:hypothetical protein